MPEQAVASRERRMSEAASLARLSEVASLYVPLAPPTSIPCVRCARLPICCHMQHCHLPT